MGNAFQLEERPDGIVVLSLDVPDQKVNTLSQAVLAELGALVDGLLGRSDIQGLLLRSGKPGQFIAGANLNELASLAYADPAQVERGLEAGHGLFDKIEQLPFPTVALVDGNCMGGGTELILSMDERIASASRSTKIALPEVKVGLIPGWGGTQRMPRLVGLQPALEMITSGEPVDAGRAAAIGLVFDVVPAERLVDEGVRLIGMLRENETWQRRRTERARPLGLSEDQKNFAFAVAEGHVRGKTKGQYPAPLLALSAIRDGANLPLKDALQVERKAAREVTGSQISANLIGVFFMTNRLGKDPGVDNPHVKPREIGRVGVLGSGLMGAGIATAHARSGLFTAMVDVDDARLEDGLKRAGDVIGSRMKIGRATAEDLGQMFAHLSTSTSHTAFSDCDVVVEAVTENEQLKTKLYGQIAEVLPADAILASNTSTISITRMAQAAPVAERFVGMHFFYPVDRMALVEVIRGEKTDDETVATIVALAKRIRKTPIVVNDCAGFLVNRILLPYMNEALLLLLEGASMDAIDKVATKFGMPVGPIALHDMVGIDTCCYAGRVMVEAYADRAVSPPLLDDLVQAGRLGKKSGRGFRSFSGRKGLPSPDPEIETFLEKHRINTREISNQEIEDRLFLAMLLEAVRTVDDGIVRQPGDADMGLILGIGFPPFRGGILRWCDNEGAGTMLKRLEPYVPLGRRFEPPDSLRQMAADGELFYPRPKTVSAFGGEA